MTRDTLRQLVMCRWLTKRWKVDTNSYIWKEEKINKTFKKNSRRFTFWKCRLLLWSGSLQLQCQHLFSISIKSGLSPINIMEQRCPNGGMRSVSRLQPAVWSIAAAFWYLSGVIRRISTNSSFSSDSIFGIDLLFRRSLLPDQSK